MHKTRHSGAQTAHTAFAGPHVAVIMDGNGRWATAHGLSRSAGHEAGLRTARDIVEASVREGVGTLTLYAFSSDNWKRPTAEVTALMRLFRRALLGEAKRCLENGVRLTILGRRDRLPSSLRHTDRAGRVADGVRPRDAPARRRRLLGARRDPPRGRGDSRRVDVARAVLRAARTGGPRPHAGDATSIS